MTRADTATRKAMTAIVAAVVLFAAGDSYTHIYDLARQHGQGMASAGLLPLAGDGVVAAASAAMLAAARNGKPVPARARVLLLSGIGATIAANVAYGLPQGATGALLSVWPVASYVGCVELLAWMREHLGAQQKTHPNPARTAPVSASADASDELKTRRERKTWQPSDALLERAEAAFPEVKNGGKVPSLRSIKDALNVGQPRQQLVQAHLRALQAATG